jgi:type IV pilus assembly protein PilO
MTVANEQGFVPGFDEQEGPPPPPGSLVVGPLVITPMIQGIALGVVGVALAGFLAWKMLLPAMSKTGEIEQKITETKTNIEGQRKRKAKLKEVTDKLEVAEQQKESVMALFGKNDFLETLLFDVNKIVVEQHKATMQTFNPVEKSSSSWIFGSEEVPGKGKPAPEKADAAAPAGPKLSEAIEGKTIEVKMEGEWQKQQATLQDLERLPAMVLMDEFRLEVDREAQKLVAESLTKYTPQGEPTLKTSFNLLAVVPLPAEELEKLAAPPPPPEEKKEEEAKK